MDSFLLVLAFLVHILAIQGVDVKYCHERRRIFEPKVKKVDCAQEGILYLLHG
jgi:hypothetical protein